jgi:NAD+ diphosphatase
MKISDGELTIPLFSELNIENAIYLFEISGKKYFLAEEYEEELEAVGFEYTDINKIRTCANKDEVFAAATAYHLCLWYRSSRFCGRCGKQNVHYVKERAMFCPSCNCINYPRISPAVIVALTDGDRIMMTKYAGRGYKKYALIAGFTEIGETAEQTVRREVMEEVGLKVKNIRYYKTQPWGFSGDLLIGYFCELDGSDVINRDETELSEAVWMKRDEMTDIEDDGLSLTREMMRVFKENKHIY